MDFYIDGPRTQEGSWPEKKPLISEGLDQIGIPAADLEAEKLPKRKYLAVSVYLFVVIALGGLVAAVVSSFLRSFGE